MPFDTINPSDRVQGFVRGSQVRSGGKTWVPINPSKHPAEYHLVPGIWSGEVDWQHNDILYDWAAAVQNLLRNSPDGKSYNVGGMYIEFDNTGADVDPVPSINRDEGASYYAGLGPTRDYLRVPLVANAASTSNVALFPGNNIATFISQSEGTVGVQNGLTFSDVANSRVYGGALVIYPEFADSSQDLIFSRYYFAPGSQIEKVAGSQVGLTWAIQFD
jgi:hypothetical protein